jgi:hypothetical protein
VGVPLSFILVVPYARVYCIFIEACLGRGIILVEKDSLAV